MATSRRYPIALSLILGGLASQALAEPPTATSNDNGLMTFKNVRVINAPPVASEQKPAADAPGMRAFVNPVTGELDDAATPQEAKQLSNAAARVRTLTNSGTTTASTDDSERLIYGPNNTVGLLLGEEDMVSVKVQVDAEGNLTQECVTGEDDAAHAAHGHTRQESKNDR
jgi:hypothetical protein